MKKFLITYEKVFENLASYLWSGFVISEKKIFLEWPMRPPFLYKVVIGKMSGSHHLLAPKISFKFSGNFRAEGWAFLKWLHEVLDDAENVTHILKDKGKLNRIIKNHSIALVTFSLKCSVPFCKFKGCFYRLQGLQ